MYVTVGPVRPDIIHPCDIWEDVAIAYGCVHYYTSNHSPTHPLTHVWWCRFNKIAWTQPKVATTASQLPINQFSDQLRAEVARCGFNEALTFALVSSFLLL